MTPEESWEVTSCLQRSLRSGGQTLSDIPKLVIRIVRHEGWRCFICEITGEEVCFKSFTEYVKQKIPNGLQTNVDTLKNLCRDNTEALDAIDRATKGRQGERTDLFDNVQEVEAPTGNSKDAALRRLRKDRPDLHKSVLSGVMSANAAMIEAGFRDPTATVVTNDAQRAARSLLRHYDATEIIQAIQEAAEAE